MPIRAARSTLDKPINTPSNEMLSVLKWMTFPEREKYQKAILLYKIIHSYHPLICKTYFNLHMKYINTILDQHLKISCMYQNPIMKFIEILKKGKRKVQGVPQSQTAALPRPQEEKETDKSKQAQTEQTYEKH